MMIKLLASYQKSQKATKQREYFMRLKVDPTWRQPWLVPMYTSL